MEDSFVTAMYSSAPVATASMPTRLTTATPVPTVAQVPVAPVAMTTMHSSIIKKPMLASKPLTLNGLKKSVWVSRHYLPGETGYTEESETIHELYSTLKDAKSKDIKKSIGKLHVKLGPKVVVKHGHWKRVLYIMSFLFHDNTHVFFLPTVATVDASDPSKTVMVDFESISSDHFHHLEAVHHPDDHHIVEFRMSETHNIPPAKQPVAKQPVVKQSSSLMDELLNAASEKLSEKIKKMMTDALKQK
jgi:hypothetical protein